MTQDRKAEWHPLLTVGASQIRVGITNSGQWVVEHPTSGNVVPMTATEPLMPLLPILESPRSAFLHTLQVQLAQAGLAPEAASNFPLLPLVHYALTFASDYWQTRALEWVAEEPVLSAQTAEILRGVYIRGATQAIRHEALRLLRQSGFSVENPA